MNMRVFLLHLLFYTLLGLHGRAQISNSLDPERLRQNVKDFDSFLRRFNFRENPMGEAIKDTAYAYVTVNGVDMKIVRQTVLPFLFNEELLLSRQQLCQQFMDHVLEKGLQLSFYDPDWYVTQLSTVKYKGTEQKIHFTLQIETHGEQGSKFVIRGVDAPFLLPSAPYDKDRLLHPGSNETSFITLNAALEDGPHFRQYLPRTYEADALTALYMEVLQGNRITYLHSNEEPEYHLLQLPGWAVIVKHFIRSEGPAGWLIADIMQLSDAEKQLYVKDVLNVRDDR
jgi:hypothetical protein